MLRTKVDKVLLQADNQEHSCAAAALPSDGRFVSDDSDFHGADWSFVCIAEVAVQAMPAIGAGGLCASVR